jgi:hypothetical protein
MGAALNMLRCIKVRIRFFVENLNVMIRLHRPGHKWIDNN